MNQDLQRYPTIRDGEDFSDVPPEGVLSEHTNGLLRKSEELQDEIANPFPVEVFPSSMQRIIRATNESLNFPIDFIGSSLLYAVSVAIGNTHRVEVKKGWPENAVLYLAIVARPGTNKSHQLSFAVKPLIERDKKAYREYELQHDEYLKALDLTKAERKAQGIKQVKKPVWNKFLLSDFTPEALAEVHKHNKRGIGVYVDELAGWFKNFNRYNKGSEEQFWLSVWSGKPINIDRKTSAPLFIPMPFISVCGSIQTGILNELAKDGRSQNGFIDRILFVIPDNIKKEYWSETDLPFTVYLDWVGIVSKLLDLKTSDDETMNPVPEVLTLSTEAKTLLFDWQKRNTDLCNNTPSDAISGSYSKMDIYAPRLALILEMMFYGCDESDRQAISKKAMQGALALVEYFKRSALKVNAIVSGGSPLNRFPENKKIVYDTLPATFSTQEGVQIAEDLNLPPRTFKRMLKEDELFVRKARGQYEKRL